MAAPAYKEKVIIITGASGGIGSELARQLAAQGARLALAARDIERLESVRAECEALGGKAICLRTDVSIKEQCAAMVRRTFEQYQRIDVLINNAGFGTRGSFAELPEDREVDEIALNVIALVRLTRGEKWAMRFTNRLPRANRYLPGLCIKLKTELTTSYNIPFQPIWIGVSKTHSLQAR